MYIGPETLMPLGTALAAISGIVMLFWQQIKRVFARVTKLFGRGDQS